MDEYINFLLPKLHLDAHEIRARLRALAREYRVKVNSVPSRHFRFVHDYGDQVRILIKIHDETFGKLLAGNGFATESTDEDEENHQPSG
jgi:hypothetical protein